MSHYTAPIKDMQFVLHEVLNTAGVLSELPDHDLVDRETVDSVLEEAGKFAAGVLSPLNAVGDEQGCRLEGDGQVKTPDGFADAWGQFVEGGWPGLSCHPDHGGQGLPMAVQIPCNEMVYAANQAWGMYMGLTRGAYECLSKVGSEAQKALYLPKLASGQWTGTMCLTEAQAGTDLGLLKTKAEPQVDGSYRLTGTKIFISAGEHDFADNIVHLVLARLPDAPPGTRGISLFVVPRHLPDENGEAGARNGLRCTSLEHKMGIHGTATCVISLEGATGWLVGEPNRGLQGMFVMMNEARLGVGMEGLGLTEGAYQRAVAYARDRVQGKAPRPPESAAAADAIIHHPDVRRMLLTQKAYVEGGRLLAYWTAQWVDIQHGHPDAERRARAQGMVEILTPIVKAYLTDNGMLCTNLAIQVLGGHGYIRESGVEQYFRDVRIKPIYEGTNGIQAMDLLGRKVLMDGGERLQALLAELRAMTASNPSDEVEAVLAAVASAAGRIGAAAQDDPALPGAVATAFLRLLAHAVVGSLWLRAADVAAAKAEQGDDVAFHAAKQATAAFYLQWLLPEAAALQRRIDAGSAPVMGLDASGF